MKNLPVLRRFGAIVIGAILMTVIVLPASIKQQLPESPLTDWLLQREIKYGLDLQGGVLLDYRLDLRKAEEYNNDDDPDNDVNVKELIQGVRATLEGRANALGLSEPLIYTSEVGDETHIIVELAGETDMDEAKEVIGKTIQLEFKTQKKDIDEEEEKKKVEKEAQAVLAQALKGTKEFNLVGVSAKKLDGSVVFEEEEWFLDETPIELQQIWDAPMGEVYNKLLFDQRGFVFDGEQLIEDKGYFIVKPKSKKSVERSVTEPGEDFETVAKEVSTDKENIDLGLKTKEELPVEIADQIWEVKFSEVKSIKLDDKTQIYKNTKEIKQEDKVKASHILIAYEGSARASEDVTRTKEEAKARAEEVLLKAKAPDADFAALAREFSDEAPAQESGGSLGEFERGAMVKPFDDAVFGMQIGLADALVETEFGYHIIKKEAHTPAGDPKKQFMVINIAHDRDDVDSYVAEIEERLKAQEVTKQENQLTAEYIFFSTSPQEWASTGLDGRHFKKAKITFDQINNPIVLIEFNDEGAKLFEELTEKYTGERMAIFVGDVMVSAPTINEKISGGFAQISGQFTVKEATALKNDLNTGAISAPVELIKQHQIGATLGKQSLELSLYAGMIGLALLAIYMLLYYRLLGLMADIALCLYALTFIFVLKTSSAIGVDIVMTLAGVAGIILSIGMAVDANVLIFERLKEELKSGKNFSQAVHTGFGRAWTSIRDSNLTTLLICGVLSWFGESTMIQGFAIMLAIGILISMFTAIFITKTFLELLDMTPTRKWGWLFGVKRIEH